MGSVLGSGRGALLTLDQLSDDTASAVQALVDRRVEQGAPVAYLIGRRDFYDLSLTVDERVLIPRPETETLVEAFASLEDQGSVPPGAVADWGTGSGAVALVTARRRPVLAIDRSPAALELASINVSACQGTGQQGIQLTRSDGLSAVRPGALAAVLANPPYVEAAEWAGLSADVQHEPRSALVPRSGDVPALYERLAAEAAVTLKPGGWLLTEIGWTQGPMVAQACTRAALGSVDILQDLAGLDRVVLAQRRAG